MKLKKSSKFVSLLPTINKLITEGYTHEGVIEKLKTDHDLVLTIATFRSYFYRIKESSKNAPDKSNTENTSDNDITENISDNIGTENKSSFLSQFSNDKKPDSENESKGGSVKTLAERQGMKGDINKSRNKAKDLLNSIKTSSK